MAITISHKKTEILFEILLEEHGCVTKIDAPEDWLPLIERVVARANEVEHEEFYAIDRCDGRLNYSPVTVIFGSHDIALMLERAASERAICVEDGIDIHLDKNFIATEELCRWRKANVNASAYGKRMFSWMIEAEISDMLFKANVSSQYAHENMGDCIPQKWK